MGCSGLGKSAIFLEPPVTIKVPSRCVPNRKAPSHLFLRRFLPYLIRKKSSKRPPQSSRISLINVRDYPPNPAGLELVLKTLACTHIDAHIYHSSLYLSIYLSIIYFQFILFVLGMWIQEMVFQYIYSFDIISFIQRVLGQP